jgi:iron(III) transport system ATP-binding protein
MSAILAIRDITIRYGDFAAVSDASLTVEPGTLAALVGPSGCGKTSLLRAIAGFEAPSAGTISIGADTLVGPHTFVPPQKRRIGMVFQEGALFPHLDVLENVAFGLPRDQIARADEALRLVGLEELSRRRPHQLSGGQQQRVALARALAPRPRLVLLDEPFGGLDAALRSRLREEVRDILRAASTTAILVTHDQEEALSIADQVSVMRNGRILQTGTPQEVYEQPAVEAVASLIGDAHLVASHVTGGRIEIPFGSLRIDAPDGPCVIRIATEDLGLMSEPGGAAAVLVTSRFYGHDVVDEFSLDDGASFRVRLPRSSGEAGSRHLIGLRKRTLRVFLSDGRAATARVETPA